MELILTSKQRADVVEIINKKVDLPWIPEFIEAQIFAPGVKVIETLVIKYVPEDLIKIAMDLSLYLKPTPEGSPEGSDVIKERLVGLLNKKIDIPFLDEEQEKELINTVLDILTSALNKDRDLDTEIQEKLKSVV